MRHHVPRELPAAQRGLDAHDTAGPVDQAKVAAWPRRVRDEVRAVLVLGITDETSPALREAVDEITGPIDLVNAAEDRGARR